MVNVRKRRNGYQYYFEIAPVNGKRKQKVKSGFKTKADAYNEGMKAYNEYNNTGHSFTPKTISYSDYLDYWIKNYCEVNLKYHTIQAYSNIIKKLDLQDKAEKLDKIKNKGKHPIQPRKGDIYLIEFGQNIGKELSNTHMGIVVQSSKNNVASHTVVVVPISSSQKLYPTYERILETDIKEGKLDKLPSKAKADQITSIDKARIVYKIGSVTDEFMERLEKRIMKNLDIKIEKKV